MKVLVWAAAGGTGRLIVRFRPGERPFRLCFVYIKTPHARKQVVDMKNTSAASFTWARSSPNR